MPLGSGQLSHISWGFNASFGTTATRTKSAELVRESIKLRAERAFSDSVRGPSKRRWFNAKRFGEGEFEVEPMYEGFELLYKGIWNKVTTSALAAPAFQHLYEFPDPDVLLGGYSIEVERDLQAFLYESARLTKVVFRGEIKKLLKAAFSVIAQNESLISVTTPVFPPEKPISFADITCKIDAVGGAGVALDIRSFEITIDNNFDNDRMRMGSLLIKEPTRLGHRMVTGQIVCDWEDMTQYNRYANGTEFKLVLTATGPAIGGSGVNETWELEIPRCVATDGTPNISDGGPIRLTLPFEGLFRNGTTEDSAKLTVKNSVTTS